MCGIVGFLSKNLGADSVENVLRMACAIAHRGPDDFGEWVDVEAGVAFGHRRLSILDLSPSGHQPMISSSGRYVIVFNGEIYNHLELRTRLNSHALAGNNLASSIAWRGHSDTETLLACFESWDIEFTVKQTVGMFAFAVWDKQNQTLTLGRDRFGEKPLYYGWQGSVFLFGSELKALKSHPAFLGEIDRGALALFVRHNYVPSPYSIYCGISKLVPGSLLTVSLQQNKEELKYYWQMQNIVASGLSDPFLGTIDQAVESLDKLITNAVSLQMAADVPLGAFLSGGVDSSTIVALMQAQSSRPISTFCIGFHDIDYNEAAQAKAVSQYLGTDHTELFITDDNLKSVIPLLPTLYDEPFSDCSQIPTFLVSQLARQRVTVALSGDAGDELFGGYSSYLYTQKVWSFMSHCPLPLRNLISEGLTAFSPGTWNSFYNLMFKFSSFLLPSQPYYSDIGDKIYKISSLLKKNTPEDVYLRMISHVDEHDNTVINNRILTTIHKQPDSWPHHADLIHMMMYFDLMCYLPSDILTKVDLAAMGVSLETRVPFLDHRLVEFVWRLPLPMKIRSGETKYLLRQVLYKYLPKELVERRKKGFGIPIGTWLRGSLREWAETLLTEDRLRREGYLNPVPIRERWKEHLSGKRNWQHYLWNILMFQAWKDSS